LSNSPKIETIFGLVLTNNITSPQVQIYDEQYTNSLPPENINFDLSFPDKLLTKKTTSRGYLKTNPPLDLYSIGITPLKLLSFFKNTNSLIFIKFYFTFINQLSIIDN
jgi:hypothetical protein